MAKITADMYQNHENHGKITASIHTPKRDVFISNGNGNGNENISNAPPTVDRRRIT